MSTARSHQPWTPRRAYRAWRLRRKGVPPAPLATHEALRACFEGLSVLVLGNAPSAKPALAYCQARFGDSLRIIGANGIGKLVQPDLYIFVDAYGLREYGGLVDPERSRAVIQPSALGKIRPGLLRDQPTLYQHIAGVCAHPGSLRLAREKEERTLDLDSHLQRIAGYSAGAAALQLALMALLPKLARRGGAEEQHLAAWEHSPKPGRLIVAGMDGYAPDQPNYFGGDLIESAQVLSAEAMAQRQLDTNLGQAAVLAQVFALARHWGIELLNLSAPDRLAVNALHRCAEFDTRESAKAAPPS